MPPTAPSARTSSRPDARRPAPPKDGTLDVSKFFDVHLQVGLQDHLVRMTRAHYQALVIHWEAGEQTVILISRSESFQTEIVLRGSEGGRVVPRKADPARKIALYEVITARDLREQILTKNGIEKA